MAYSIHLIMEKCRMRSVYLILTLFACGPASIAENRLEREDCLSVQCPDIAPCPPDSYRNPTIVDHQLHHSMETDENLSTEMRRCCPLFEKCHCIPGLHCSAPECPLGETPKIVQNATGKPGFCCPKFQCTNAFRKITGGGECNFEGQNHRSGESWSHKEGCKECICHNGVVSCKPQQCEPHPECRHVLTPPHSCCPVCAGCVTSTGGVYNNSETWEEGPCTTCTCIDGRIKCHAAMCQSTCPNPIYVPGECCPRCSDGSEMYNRHSNCPFLDCHRRECPLGFQLDKVGCPTCKCMKCPSLLGCNKNCKFGFETDEKHCSICECRTGAADLITPLSPASSDDSQSWCPRTSNGRIRQEGEEWFDGCRRCICKDGHEMCTLITCTPPACEHPIFFPGDCCPRCPDEGMEPASTFNISVCQSSDGSERLEGEVWTLSPCLTCTCHSGQVLCSVPDCPPTPCSNSFMKNPTDCCLSCPQSSFSREHDITNNSSHSSDVIKASCLSDDSATSYAHGKTWKVGACQSCICIAGKIQCHSSARCPTLQCKRPVLAKNQCCPVCLDHGGSNSTGEEKELSGSGGLEPYCAVLIVVFMSLSLCLGLIVLRQCMCRRSSSRLIKKAPPSFHSSSSSNAHETPPVTPDCCYKCDYSYPNRCAQLSEQKPLFKPSSDSPSPVGNNSDKV